MTDQRLAEIREAIKSHETNCAADVLSELLLGIVDELREREARLRELVRVAFNEAYDEGKYDGFGNEHEAWEVSRAKQQLDQLTGGNDLSKGATT